MVGVSGAEWESDAENWLGGMDRRGGKGKKERNGGHGLLGMRQDLAYKLHTGHSPYTPRHTDARLTPQVTE